MPRERLPHVITANHGNEKPIYAVYLDSESRVDQATGEHSPYLVVACFKQYKSGKKTKEREEWREYHGPDVSSVWDDVANWGKRTKCRVYVYGHNLFYDVQVTGGIPVLCRHGFKVTSFFEKASVFILTMKNEDAKKTITFLSSTNYFAQPLAKLGKVFSLDKLQYDYAEGSLEEAIVYCRRDVEICKTAVEAFRDFVERENLGVLARTLAGQAFNAYRHRFMPVPLYVHNNEDAIRLEREAYAGGRVECWRIGSFVGDVRYYDVNSMYPYVMRSFLYPTRLLSFRRHNTVNFLKESLRNGLGIIARVKIRTEKPFFPCKLDGNLVFPTGNFWTTLCTPEIKFALERDLISDVGEMALYAMDDIFSSYVDYFYQKRKEAKAAGDDVRQLMYKLLLNSLYGKFGQLSESWERVGDADPSEVKVLEVFDAETGKKTMLKIFGGSVFRRGETGEAFNSMCAIAAHVTSYARMTLLKYIEIAGWENVLYMDTDSLFVTAEGAERLSPYVSSSELGAIKEEDRAPAVVINAPKDYTFGEHIKMKGIKKGSKQIDGQTWETEVWPRLSSFIREGRLKGYRNIKRIKVLAREYNKGWVLKTGEVKPIELMVNDAGLNEIVPWFDRWTLRDPSQPEKIAKHFRGAWPVDMEAIYKKELKKEEEARRREFRKAIMAEGGVWDPDYEDLPRWCRRRRGRRLDELVLNMQALGWPVETAEDLYKLLKDN